MLYGKLYFSSRVWGVWIYGQYSYTVTLYVVRMDIYTTIQLTISNCSVSTGEDCGEQICDVRDHHKRRTKHAPRKLPLIG